MRLTPCCLLSPLCASRAVVTTATVVIVLMQTADRASSELAGMRDKGGTLRAEDYNFFVCKTEAKVINYEQDFLYTPQYCQQFVSDRVHVWF